MKLKEILEKIDKSNLLPNEKVRSKCYIVIQVLKAANRDITKVSICDILLSNKALGDKKEQSIFNDYKINEDIKYPPYCLLSIFMPELECATSKITSKEFAFYYHNLLTRWKSGEGSNLNFSLDFHVNKFKTKEIELEYEHLIKIKSKTKKQNQRIEEILESNKELYYYKHFNETGRKVNVHKICYMNQYLISKGLMQKENNGEVKVINKLLFLETSISKITETFMNDIFIEKDVKDIKIELLEKEIILKDKLIKELQEQISQKQNKD